MRMVVITVALILFFSGGLAAVTWVLSNFEDLSDGVDEVVLVKGFVSLDNISYPVSSGTVLDRYVGVELRLEINDVRREAEITALMPRIRDEIIRDAHLAGARRADGVNSNDLTRVKDRAKASANKVLGGEVVTRVLITRVARLVA
jgi:flagellar basal body-associated protein FliL